MRFLECVGARKIRLPCYFQAIVALAIAPAATIGGFSGSLRTPRRDEWRWQLLQIPKDAVEFQFTKPDKHNGSDPFEPRSLLKEPPSWWRARDKAFEEEGLFCNARWLGVQVLQSPEDLIHLQQVLVLLRPQVVLETGTYRGGLAIFIASVLSQLGLERSRVVTMDVFDMESNYNNLDNHPLCPVCDDCLKAHETDLWRKHVVFFQGNSLRLSRQVHRFVTELHAHDGHWGPTLVSLDAQHSYDGTLTELHYYAGLVDPGSYLVLQDARLDSTYGRAGPLAAGARLAEDTLQWRVDAEIAGSGYTQHLWLRRIAPGPPVNLMFDVFSMDLVGSSPFTKMAEGARCTSAEPPLSHIDGLDSDFACMALCFRVPNVGCRFLSFSIHSGCTLWEDCPYLAPERNGVVYEQTGHTSLTS